CASTPSTPRTSDIAAQSPDPYRSLYMIPSCCLWSGHWRVLHSFPTRRSSDLRSLLGGDPGCFIQGALHTVGFGNHLVFALHPPTGVHNPHDISYGRQDTRNDPGG